jgi:hypothetical protein
VFATPKGTFPDFHEAFTQLHLGQLPAYLKCIIGDRRDGGIDPNADDIARSLSTRPSVDEGLVDIHFDIIFHTITRQNENNTKLPIYLTSS